MSVRLASPDEAEQLWNIRNQAIRFGCKESYEASVINAWTPDKMPDSYRKVIAENPFFVVDGPEGEPVATGFLAISSGSVEAIFTLPDFTGKGMASLIIDAIKDEARKRGFTRITLASTPNATTFYQKQGFVLIRESLYPSALARTDLRCIDMTFEFEPDV